MKKIIILLIILFFFVFFKSNTLEQKQWKEERNGLEYLRTSFNLNWNNFSTYLQQTCQTVADKLNLAR
jgi:hypothetical protein